MEVFVNRYNPINILGQGHFGAVYHVYDMIVQAEKALKIIPFSTQQQLIQALQEAVSMQSCNHQNILKIYGAQITQVGSSECLLIDMEYVPDGSLESRMRTSYISPVKARKWAIDCLFGLHHLHNCDRIHRDIKPANILLKNNQAIISDLGLCTILDSAHLSNTAGYTTHLPPEFFVDGTTSILSDVYAFGMTLFRIVNNYTNWEERVLTLSHPMQFIQQGALIKKIGYQPYVPFKLKKIINKACNPDSSLRYASAQELREALEKLTPKIDWSQNGNNWTGYSPSLKKNYKLNISSNRKHKVDYLENNRRQSNLCSSFDTLEEAIQYTQSIVCGSSF